MLHLDLHGAPPLTLDFESPLDQLADDHHAITFVKGLRHVLGDRAPCRAAGSSNDVALF